MNKKHPNIVLILFAFGLLLSLSACSAPVKPYTVNGFYFDTFVTLTLYEDTPAAKQAAQDFLSECARYDALFSKSVEGSDIQKINSANGAPVTVSTETISLLQTALHYCALSNGAADPAIGAVTSLWDFSQTETESSHLPEEASITTALSHVDPADITIDGNTVTLNDPSLQLDPGFIAKGYIADRLKENLIAQGITSGIINLGGNIAVLGSKPDGSSYTVGIEKPFSQGTPLYTITASDTSVVTSGVYQRCFTCGGKLYHHILDPQTGYPVENNLYSVTIVCTDSVTADALSTACFVLGLEKGMELIESIDGVEGMFLDTDMQPHTSSGFPAYELTK